MQYTRCSILRQCNYFEIYKCSITSEGIFYDSIPMRPAIVLLAVTYALIPGVIVIVLFVLLVLLLEPDSDGGRIVESVGVGRKRTLQS
jgi:hypothetical protein